MAVLNPLTTQSNSSQQTPPTKKKPSKFGSAFKKVGKYLQQQAQEQSHSALYLSPRDLNHLEDAEYTHCLEDDPTALPYGVIPPISSNATTLFSQESMSTDTPSEQGILQSIVRHQYASDNILQSYDVLIPERDSSASTQEQGYFIIFIHGGYFRDPTKTSKGFYPTISLLESDSTPSSIRNKITGYASINYRLSPHPDHPQDPKTTPSYTLNNARWPNQPTDILAAIRHIQSHYPQQSRRYILSGHSVGATLSFITALRCTEENLIAPTTVMGICGIYDFPRIHRTNVGYEDLTRNAMGEDEYEEASPGLVGVEEFRRRWVVKSESGEGKRGVVLAQPVTDELVGVDQTEVMGGVFRDHNGDKQEQGKVADGFELEVVEEVKGTHWEILENGELARCLGQAIRLFG